MIVLLDMAVSQERAEVLGHLLFGRWQRGLRRKGGDATEERGVNIKVCDLGDLSSGALGSYLSKIGHEVAGSHTKDGRGVESYTMVGLLREVKDTYEVQAFAALRELEQTASRKRRKFLTWSNGARELRARAGHGRHDKTDEELAEEDDLASPDLVAVDRDDWARLVEELPALLRVGETHGMNAAKAWMTVRGIRWRDLVEAPRLTGRSRTSPPERPPDGWEPTPRERRRAERYWKRMHRKVSR